MKDDKKRYTQYTRSHRIHFKKRFFIKKYSYLVAVCGRFKKRGKGSVQSTASRKFLI